MQENVSKGCLSFKTLIEVILTAGCLELKLDGGWELVVDCELVLLGKSVYCFFCVLVLLFCHSLQVEFVGVVKRGFQSFGDGC